MTYIKYSITICGLAVGPLVKTGHARIVGCGSQPGRIYKLLSEGGDELPTEVRAVVDSWLLFGLVLRWRARQGVTWAPLANPRQHQMWGM